MIATPFPQESSGQSDGEETQTRIDLALAAYRPEFRLAQNYSYAIGENSLVTRIAFPPYPFIGFQVSYTSINLINLSIEQAVLLHLDLELDAGRRSGKWQTIDAYREEVNAGGWLVADLATEVRKPIPRNAELDLITKLRRDHHLKSTYFVHFVASCPRYFKAEGLAAFP